MPADLQPQLEWERRRRPLAVGAALAAAVLPLGAGIANAVVYNRAPRASLLSSLQRAFDEGPVGQLPSLHLPLYDFYQHNFPLLLAIAVINAIGLVATGSALTFLGMATRARRPQFWLYAVYLPVAAGVLFALAGLGLVVATNVAVGSLLDGPRTVSAVTDWQGGAISTGRWVESLARLLLGIGFVVVCLNAMRTGLLTRFMGVLGIISGALLVLPIGGPLPIVQAFWFVALAVSVGNRWPGAVPPAWRTGRAEPWPSQQQMREARADERERDEDERERDPGTGAKRSRARGDDAAGAAAAAPVVRSPRSATGKRKRKGRS